MCRVHISTISMCMECGFFCSSIFFITQLELKSIAKTSYLGTHVRERRKKEDKVFVKHPAIYMAHGVHKQPRVIEASNDPSP